MGIRRGSGSRARARRCPPRAGLPRAVAKWPCSNTQRAAPTSVGCASEASRNFARCAKPIVVIDEFHVPGDGGYGSYDGGPGKALTSECVRFRLGHDIERAIAFKKKHACSLRRHPLPDLGGDRVVGLAHALRDRLRGINPSFSRIISWSALRPRTPVGPEGAESRSPVAVLLTTCAPTVDPGDRVALRPEASMEISEETRQPRSFHGDQRGDAPVPRTHPPGESDRHCEWSRVAGCGRPGFASGRRPRRHV